MNIKSLLLIFISLIAGLYVVIEVLTARSGIGQLYLYFAIAALFLGLASPKKALYVLGFCCIYIDFFKRLMIIGGKPSFMEVSYALAIPPLLVAGATTSVVLSLILSKKPLRSDQIIAFALATVIALGSCLAVLLDKSEGGSGRISAMVNQGFYAYLIFLIPQLLPENEERRKFLAYIFSLIIPAVFYMFWQQFHGLMDFEYDYLKSGLTIEGRHLVESSSGELRKFSTFNGVGTASIMISIFSLYCLISLNSENKSNSHFKKCINTLLFPLFWVAAYFTIARSGWVCGLTAIFTYFILKNRIRCSLGILVGATSVITMILLAPVAIKQKWTDTAQIALSKVVFAVTDSAEAKRAVVLATMSERLQGWSNLTQEPRLWTPFGFAAAGMSGSLGSNADYYWGHDLIVDSLIKYGYVPLALAGLLGIYGVRKFLIFMYRMNHKSLSFKLSRLSIATVIGILIGGLGSASQLRVFPQNAIMMLNIAVLFSIYLEEKKRLKEEGQFKQLEKNSFGTPPEYFNAPAVAKQ